MEERKRRRLGWILAAVFAVAVTLGAGPGIALVNRPGSIPIAGVKLPYLYAWGVLWYLVEAACVVLAYLWVWRDPDEG